MCGIFGWITPGRTIPRKLAAAALDSMRHRGPDDEGYLFCRLEDRQWALAGGRDSQPQLDLPSWDDPRVVPGADLVFGFRRLSIHDLSAAGHQPMGTPDGDLWIVFNGEVYNFIELRAALEAEGTVFRSRTDTEVILRAYEKWGPDCLHRFNGMWAMAILDLREPGRPEVFLARDRCGVKPLFHAPDGHGGFVFASELKAVVIATDRRKAARVAVGNFVGWGRLPSPQAGDTFVEGIRQLVPGCCGRVEGGDLRVRRYWDLPPGDAAPLPAGDAVEQLRLLLDDAVRLRLRADVRVGSCLSGGLDSSILVGMIHRQLHAGGAAGLQHAFSAVYDQEGPFNEKRFIDIVLHAVGAEGHFVKPDGQRLACEFQRLAWHQDEPFPTTSMFAQWCVMDLARRAGVTVLIDGQASDELLAGYLPFRQHLGDALGAGGPAVALDELCAIRRAGMTRGVGRIFMAALISSLLPQQTTQWAAREAYAVVLRRRLTRLLEPSLAGETETAVLDPDRPESYVWRRTTESTDAHLRGLVREFTLPHLLRYEDRNSMAHGIEARVPFTDYRVVELCFSGAMAPHRIRDGWSKWALRKAGHGLVPDAILWRRDKMGFGTPENEFIRSLATSWIDQRGDLARSEGLIRGAPAKALIHEAASSGAGGNRPDMMAAFRILGVEQWLCSLDLHH